MAVSVDKVYRTVLLIMNKEQRGYLTPDEFNKIGTQVQLEIFNEYFEDLNQQLRIPENDSEYANRVKNLEEKLAPFKNTPATATYVSNYFNLPTPSSYTGQEIFSTVSGQQLYYFSNLQAADVAAGTIQVFKNGVLLAENTDYIISPGGTFVQLTTIPTSGEIIQVDLYTNDFYKIGTVIYNDEKEVERVDRNNFLHINMSPLTRPTTKYPVYIFEDNKLYVYPTSITSGIKASYIRKPKNINWGFTSTGTGYFYNPTNTVDFELHSTEQTSLITRVLLYAGVVIKDPQIVQLAAGQVQQEKVNEKS
jgi:hypothetical protein